LLGFVALAANPFILEVVLMEKMVGRLVIEVKATKKRI